MKNYTLNYLKVEELKNKLKEQKEHYEAAILILTKLKSHLKTKKDGSDFQNIKSTFDIDNFKYDYKIFLNITDYDFELYYYNKQGNKKYIYITRRFYLDTFTPEKQEEIRQKYNCIKQSYIREYYNITSKKDIAEQIERTIKTNQTWLNQTTQKYNKLDLLIKSAEDFIKSLNENCKIDDEDCFYRSEIASIFNY